jgi:hypothetical protein
MPVRRFAILLMLGANLANAGPVIVKNSKFNGIMPFVESSDKEVALSINTTIYSDMLEMPAPKKWQQSLQNVPEQAAQSQSEITYEVSRNDGKILSIQIEAEGCGAYCESYTSFFNFNIANGEPIAIQDMVTEKGLISLDKKLIEIRTTTLKKEITRLQSEAKNTAAAKGKDDTNPYEDSIVLYQDCLATMADISLADSRFKIDKDHIVFIYDRCSNHAMRAADTLDQFQDALSFEAIKSYLNDYGKQLLLSKAKIKMKTP